MICNLGGRVVNTYLISFADGFILIDTGYESDWPHFLKMLAGQHIKMQEIKYVFLTHAHDDHAGFLNNVLEHTDAKVILHPKAIDGLRKGQNSFEGGCSSRLAYTFCQLLALFGHGDHRYPPIRETFLSRLVPIDSDAFHALDFPFRIIETPGHTADHISLLADDILFCGDAAMNNFPSRNRVIIWIEDLRQFRQSWDTILNAAPVMLYPAHGKPFPTADLKKYLPALDSVKLYPLRNSRRGAV